MKVVVFCFFVLFEEQEDARAYFLKSASSLNMSSSDSLLLSCLYRGEKRAPLSKVPEASLNTSLQGEINVLFFCFVFVVEKGHISVSHW